MLQVTPDQLFIRDNTALESQQPDFYLLFICEMPGSLAEGDTLMLCFTVSRLKRYPEMECGRSFRVIMSLSLLHDTTSW